MRRSDERGGEMDLWLILCVCADYEGQEEEGS